MPYTDQTISCQDCGQEFVFTAGEQEFHAQKGFSNAPSRCKPCRAARKAASGDRGNGFSTGGGGGAFDAPRREMFPATCAECGQETQVPFQPSGSRPVYCRNCFSQRPSGGGGGGGRSGGGRSGGGGGRGRY